MGKVEEEEEEDDAIASFAAEQGLIMDSMAD